MLLDWSQGTTGFCWELQRWEPEGGSRKADYKQPGEERGRMGGAFQAGDQVHKHGALQYLSKLRTQGTWQRE